jgi:hypothetical protein
MNKFRIIQQFIKCFSCSKINPSILPNELIVPLGGIANLELNFLTDWYYPDRPDIDTFIFEEGEYKTESLFTNSVNYIDKLITIRGAGVDKTFLRGWDFVGDCDKIDVTMGMISNVRYEDLTILNLGFEHYSGLGVDHTGRKFELVNVKHEFTLGGHPGGYACYLITKGLQIYFRNYELKCYADSALYSGIYFLDGIVTIDSCKVGDYFSKPFVCQGPLNPQVKNLSTKGGITGIFFGANKLSPLDGFLVEDCVADGASEECLSFDCYGNNVGLNPCIVELSVLSVVSGANTKFYCDARKIRGVHPDEYYEDYLFASNEDYIKKFYLYFSQLSGLGGNVLKITDVGTDEIGQYVITEYIDTTALTLNDYKSVSVMGGFFNGIVRNNIVKNGNATGLALYQAFFNNLVEGNSVENCVGGSYLYAGKVLALGVWNGADGNMIRGNYFEDGFEFAKYGGIKGYNNTYLGNTGAVVDPIVDEVNLTSDL